MKPQRVVSVVGDYWQARAKQLVDDQIQMLRYDPREAKEACSEGVDLIEKNSDTFRSRYPGIDLEELTGLPELCDRISALQRDETRYRPLRSANGRALIEEALAWRRKLMPIAVSLATNGRIDAVALARVRLSATDEDHVNDVLVLAELLTPHAIVVAQTCDKNGLRDARQAATAALTELGAKSPNASRYREVVSMRDRYGTLLALTHDRLRAAVAIFTSYKKAATIVGPLSPRSRRKPKPAPVVPDEPAVNPS